MCHQRTVMCCILYQRQLYNIIYVNMYNVYLMKCDSKSYHNVYVHMAQYDIRTYV